MLYENEVINGTYQVLREIGKGGMGVVYLGYHKNLQKYIVLKRIAGGMKNLSELRRETDILKNLRHSRLPQIYDFVIHHGEVFTVMDYIEGTSLEKAVDGPNLFSEKQLTDWFRQLTEVLVYLHSRRPPVIHSDIKPGNIIITPEKNLVLIDFNISLKGNGPEKVVGFSRNYASPEQGYLARMTANGASPNDSLDGRTDIYSTGALFYYLATGAAPDCFQPSVPLCQRKGLYYSEAFLSVIDRCMAWDRSKRYQSARKLLHAIEQLRKKDKRYRFYLMVRLITWIASAGLVGVGLFSLSHGMVLRKESFYSAEYDQLVDYSEQSDWESAQLLAEQLLNENAYGRFLKKNPEQEANIYLAIAEAEFAQEKYSYAAVHYEMAWEKLEGLETDTAQLLRDSCGINEAIAKAYDGDADAAEKVLAYKCSADELEQLLIRMIAADQKHDIAKMESLADYLIARTSDSACAARACLLCADARQADHDILAQIGWLKKAISCQENPAYYRMTGIAGLEVAGDGLYADSDRTQAAQTAVWAYQTLQKAGQVSFTDRINYALSLRSAGKRDDAIRMLMTLRNEAPDHFIVSAYLALALEENGQLQEAGSCRNQALILYQKKNRHTEQEQLLYERLLS